MYLCKNLITMYDIIDFMTSAILVVISVGTLLVLIGMFLEANKTIKDSNKKHKTDKTSFE